MHQDGVPMQEKEMFEEHMIQTIRQINWEMAESALDYIRSALDHFGVPPSTFADDQFNNFLAMYNRRGDMITAMNKEADALRDQIRNMEEVLVSLANWPNRENHDQIRAMKVWAASVVDPRSVGFMKPLFEGDREE